MLKIKYMLPDYRPIFAIGYNYNYQKVLSFISTEDTGIKNYGINYLSKYPDQFSNVTIHPVAIPLVMYKIFGYVNEVESHKKFIHSDLALVKYWVTQCGCIRLCTTFSMGITIKNFWRLFCYGVKQYHYVKLICIR